MMTNILGKTWSSLSKAVTNVAHNKQGSAERCDELQHFLAGVLAQKSKYEEQNVISKELISAKRRLAIAETTLVEKQVVLLKLLYCCLLGYDISFAGIHAINLTQQGNLSQKKTGYLLCSLFLDKDDDLIMLLVNTIHKDLRSQHDLEVVFALKAAAEFIPRDLVSSFIPDVLRKLEHPRSDLKKNAVMSLGVFLQKQPSCLSMSTCRPKLMKALCDLDPWVMASAVSLFTCLVQTCPSSWLDLTSPLCDILSQIIKRMLPVDFSYHTVPAPWLTINILKLLAAIGAASTKECEKIYPVLKDLLRKIDHTKKIGLAVIYECLQTVCSLPPHQELLQSASKSTAKFLESGDVCLIYLGLKMSSRLVKIHPVLIKGQEDIILQCLEHQDETVRFQALDLLYSMATHKNALVISVKLAETLVQTKDTFVQTSIASQLFSIAKTHNKNIELFLKIMSDLALFKTDILPDDFEDCIMSYTETVEEEERRDYMVKYFWSLLHRETLPLPLIRIAIWVLSQNVESVVTSSVNMEQVAERCLFWLRAVEDLQTQLHIVRMFKFLLPYVDDESVTKEVSACCSDNLKQDFQLRQAVCELHHLSEDTEFLSSVVKRMKSSEEMDFTLSFLDEFICESLEAGGQPCNPFKVTNNTANRSINLDQPLRKLHMTEISVKSMSSHPASEELSSADGAAVSTEVKPPVFAMSKKVWSKEGYASDQRSHKKTETFELEETSSENFMREKLKKDLFSGITFNVELNTETLELDSYTDNSCRLAPEVNSEWLTISNSSISVTADEQLNHRKQNGACENIQELSGNYDMMMKEWTETKATGVVLDKPTDKLADKPTHKPADKPTDKPAEPLEVNNCECDTNTNSVCETEHLSDRLVRVGAGGVAGPEASLVRVGAGGVAGPEASHTEKEQTGKVAASAASAQGDHVINTEEDHTLGNGFSIKNE